VILLTEAALFAKWQSLFTQLWCYRLRLEQYLVAIDDLLQFLKT